jgi:hypothetical protein
MITTINHSTTTMHHDQAITQKIQQEHEQILPHNNKIAPTISKIHSKFTPTTTITPTISTNTYHNKQSLQNRNQHQTNTYITTSNHSKLKQHITSHTTLDTHLQKTTLRGKCVGRVAAKLYR